MVFDLKKLIINESSQLTAWVSFKGIDFELVYISRASLTRLLQNCSKMEYNEKTKSREQRVDQEAFAREFCKRVVKNWRGVTVNSLANLIPIDLALVPAEERDIEFPFSQEALQEIIKNAFELDGFLQDTAIDIKVFRPDLEAELKNLKASQSGASSPDNSPAKTVTTIGNQPS